MNKQAAAAGCTARQCRGAARNKREAILDAAGAVFLEAGYAAASMDSVAARASVSKATIYAHFENKETLFAELIRSGCRDAFAKIALPDADEDGLQSSLYAMGLQMHEVLHSPEAVAMYRVVIAESARQPEVGALFCDALRDIGTKAMTTYFQGMDERGILKVPDPVLAADMFVGLLKNNQHAQLLFGVEKYRYPADTVVAEAVRIFLAAYRA